MSSRASAQRREVQKVLADLGEPELRVARDFLEFLRSKKADPATIEILRTPALLRDVRAARADLRKGRMSRFAPWEKVKSRHG